MKDIEAMEEWHEEISCGKMFGVMVVRTADGKTGFLRAYSGQIGGREDWPGWVPAVFDYLSPGGYFMTREAEISEINRAIDVGERDLRVAMMRARLSKVQEEATRRIEEYRNMMAESKRKRTLWSRLRSWMLPTPSVPKRQRKRLPAMSLSRPLSLICWQKMAA